MHMSKEEKESLERILGENSEIIDNHICAINYCH